MIDDRRAGTHRVYCCPGYLLMHDWCSGRHTRLKRNRQCMRRARRAATGGRDRRAPSEAAASIVNLCGAVFTTHLGGRSAACVCTVYVVLQLTGGIVVRLPARRLRPLSRYAPARLSTAQERQAAHNWPVGCKRQMNTAREACCDSPVTFPPFAVRWSLRLHSVRHWLRSNGRGRPSGVVVDVVALQVAS